MAMWSREDQLQARIQWNQKETADKAATVDAILRDPHNAAFNAPVAQLDRVPGYELGGREFESLRARHISIMAGALLTAMDGGNPGKAGVFFGQPVMRREGA